MFATKYDGSLACAFPGSLSSVWLETYSPSARTVKPAGSVAAIPADERNAGTSGTSCPSLTPPWNAASIQVAVAKALTEAASRPLASSSSPRLRVAPALTFRPNGSLAVGVGSKMISFLVSIQNTDASSAADPRWNREPISYVRAVSGERSGLLPNPGNAKSCSGVGGRNESAYDAKTSTGSAGRNVTPARKDGWENVFTSEIVGSGIDSSYRTRLRSPRAPAVRIHRGVIVHMSCRNSAAFTAPAVFREDGALGSYDPGDEGDVKYPVLSVDPSSSSVPNAIWLSPRAVLDPCVA